MSSSITTRSNEYIDGKSARKLWENYRGKLTRWSIIYLCTSYYTYMDEPKQLPLLLPTRRPPLPQLTMVFASVALMTTFLIFCIDEGCKYVSTLFCSETQQQHNYSTLDSANSISSFSITTPIVVKPDHSRTSSILLTCHQSRLGLHQILRQGITNEPRLSLPLIKALRNFTITITNHVSRSITSVSGRRYSSSSCWYTHSVLPSSSLAWTGAAPKVGRLLRPLIPNIPNP